METTVPPPQPQTSAQYFFTPLIISMACMFATFLAIVTYHFLIVSYCVRRRQAQASSAARTDRNSPLGVDEKVLQRIPIICYGVDRKLGSSDTDCVVCLGEMEEGDAVRVLPTCRHVFHVACIDRWFLAHSSCPVCRSPVTVTPPPDQLPVTNEPTIGNQLRRLSSTGTGLLRRAVSIVFPTEMEKLHSGGREQLGRSLSMDQTDVVITVIPSETVFVSVATTTASSSSSSSSSSQIHDVTVSVVSG